MVVVAYRSRHAINTVADPLGAIPDNDTQRIDYERARTGLATLPDRPADEDPTTGTMRSAVRRGL